MYRNNIDNTVTYTPDDLDLFRESPFAVWMERLTLENPDHGILPDRSADGRESAAESPDSIVETLRAEGRQVAAIDPVLEEVERRAATIAAMQNGADFIVNGQLAAGTYSGRATLLMRTSGYSDLGDYLYIPCEPEAGSRFQSGFRLSCIANLLHDLQGQLPPQMLIIRDGTDVVPLPTEDHIHYYRAVQERFERTMQEFRKHRMPDPAESSHFGRWSDCASEVLKQRAQRDLPRDEEVAEAAGEETVHMPSLRVAAGAPGSHAAYDTSVATRAEIASGYGRDAAVSHPGGEPGHTLAERARMLAPGTFRVGAGPGRTPNLARFPRAGAVEPAVTPAPPEPELPVVEPDGADPGRNDADVRLQGLEFIGASGRRASPVWELLTRDAPAAPPPSLRRTREPQEPLESPVRPDDRAGEAPGTPRFLPADSPLAKPWPPRGGVPEPGRTRPGYNVLPGVDPDRAPAASLTPVRNGAPSPGGGEGGRSSPKYRRGQRPGDNEGSQAPSHPFDDRLNTSADFEDE